MDTCVNQGYINTLFMVICFIIDKYIEYIYIVPIFGAITIFAVLLHFTGFL